jgi:two-component system, NtrC family, sensor kinase
MKCAGSMLHDTSVQCVLAQINQVFMNLLGNAAQAIETQGKVFVRSGTENGHV